MRYFSLMFILFGFATHAQDLRNSLSSPSRHRNHQQQEKSMQRRDNSDRMMRWEEERKTRLMEELNISEREEREQFRRLYDEYDSNQKEIKRKFRPNRNFDDLSDAEARHQLDESFRVGKELLENRQRYSEEFQKVIKPQKVLKMFDQEGKMRREMLQRRDQSPTMRRR